MAESSAAASKNLCATGGWIDIVITAIRSEEIVPGYNGSNICAVLRFFIGPDHIREPFSSTTAETTGREDGRRGRSDGQHRSPPPPNARAAPPSESDGRADKVAAVAGPRSVLEEGRRRRRERAPESSGQRAH